jgi:hypothetical protein
LNNEDIIGILIPHIYHVVHDSVEMNGMADLLGPPGFLPEKSLAHNNSFDERFRTGHVQRERAEAKSQQGVKAPHGRNKLSVHISDPVEQFSAKWKGRLLGSIPRRSELGKSNRGIPTKVISLWRG